MEPERLKKKTMAMFSEDLFSIFEEEADSKASTSKKRGRGKTEEDSIKAKKPKEETSDGSKSVTNALLEADNGEEADTPSEPVVLDEPVVQDDVEEAEEKDEQ